MKASVEHQQAALELARLDAQISRTTHLLATLPEIAELKELTLSANSARDFRIAAETELKDVQRELARAEADVEQIVSRIERDEKRLNSGQGAAKELEQLQHELGTLAARRKELEEVELEIMLRVDDIKVRITAHIDEESEFQSRINDAEIRKANAETALQNELNGYKNSREGVAAQIPTELTTVYEKARTDRGIGAAALSEGKCAGCNLAINAVEIARIKGLAADEVVRCEECRCILVRAN